MKENKKRNAIFVVILLAILVSIITCRKKPKEAEYAPKTANQSEEESFLGQNLDLLENSNGRIVSSILFKIESKYSDRVECYRIRYLSDGLEVVAFLVKPRHKNYRYPAMIYNHGGNREFGKINIRTLKYLSYLSSRDYVVVASQYRGNDGGQGKEEFGGSDVNDVLNLIPMLESLPYVDPDKIVMLGYSRGGMMTYLAIKEGAKLKAACVVGGITDLIQWYDEREDVREKVLEELIGGWPKTKEIEYKKRSAYYWPEKIDVPVLILHGEDDWRVKASQAKKLADKLKELGKTYELVIYPRGSHSLKEYAEDKHRRIFEWFVKYLQ